MTQLTDNENERYIQLLQQAMVHLEEYNNEVGIDPNGHYQIAFDNLVELKNLIETTN